MKLHYYKSNPANFGDELNAYIWEALLPEGIFDGTEPTFLGIGTLINEHLDEKEYWVLGSGVGYGSRPKPSTKLRIFALRGPESALVLGVPSALAVTDAALFLRRVWPQFVGLRGKKCRYAYMPHFSQHLAYGDTIRWCCEKIAVTYISPCDSVDVILERIAKTEVLLAEAMHGAIVADCLGTRWVPIRTYSGVNAFKWTDWCSSVGLKYKPYSIQKIGSVLKLGNPLRVAISFMFALQLRLVCLLAIPTLSSRSLLEEREARLWTALEELVAAWRLVEKEKDRNVEKL